MWDGGNVAHYAPSHPRVLIDGEPRAGAWIDLADLKRRGAVVVWTDRRHRRHAAAMQVVAAHAGASAASLPAPRCSSRFEPCPTSAIAGTVTVGWAILPPSREITARRFATAARS